MVKFQVKLKLKSVFDCIKVAQNSFQHLSLDRSL